MEPLSSSAVVVDLLPKEFPEYFTLGLRIHPAPPQLSVSHFMVCLEGEG